MSKAVCNSCSSEDVKKRKNKTHGSGSKTRVSYVCNACNSSNVKAPQQQFRRR